MFNKVILKGIKIRRTLIALALLGGSLAVHADREDSLQSYNYFFLEAMRQQDMGNLTAAFDLLRHARDLNPAAPEVYYQLAAFYVDMKKDALAREYFEKAASLDPENSAYQEKLGKLYVSQKDYPNAIKAFERLYEANKTRSDVLQLLYQLYGSQNDYKMMIKCLERLETVEGTNEQISLSKMQIYEQMGEKRKEYDELKALVDGHPLDLNYRVMFGNWLLQNGKKKEALQKYRDVLKEDPDNSLAKVSMMDYYNNIGDKASVKTILRELLQSPKTAQTLKLELLRQVIASSQKDNNPDSTEVLRLFSEALAVPQENADIYMLKAAYMSFLKLPKPDITRVYERAIETEPDNSSARIALIQNIWDTHDYDKVIAICRPAIEYNPDEMIFYYFQGMAQFQKHDNNAALETFRKGVGQIKPDSDPSIVSEAKHISTSEYYKSLIGETENLQSELQTLETNKGQLQSELKEVKRDIKMEKLKSSAVNATTAITDSVSSLFGSNKVKRLEEENKQLKADKTTLEGNISTLKKQMTTSEMVYKQQVETLKYKLAQYATNKQSEDKKLEELIPYLADIKAIVRECLQMGFATHLIRAIACFKKVSFSGSLYSKQHNRKFDTEQSVAYIKNVVRAERKNKWQLFIDELPVVDWFKMKYEQWKEKQNLMQQPTQHSGIRR